MSVVRACPVYKKPAANIPQAECARADVGEARTEREAGAGNTHQEFSNATCSKRPGVDKSSPFLYSL